MTPKTKRLIADQGCIVCRHNGIFTPAGLHHVRKLATSKKRKLAPVIPLCAAHHQTGGYGIALHSGEEEWERRYGSVLDMVKETYELIRDTDSLQ